MKFKNIYILLLFPFVLICCKGAANAPHDNNPPAKIVKPDYIFVNEFEKFVREIMVESHIPGAAIAIVQDTTILLLKGYGVKTYGTTDSVDIHSVFRIASVSKGFASMLTGILVQEKQMSWDDKVIKYLPDFKLKNATSTQQLSIRNILSHTSGLPTHTFSNMVEEGIPFETLKNNLQTIDVTAPVGKEFAYQNVIYSVISDVDQAVTKKTYAQLLREKIFLPLGMTDASASFDEIMADKNVAMPHLQRGGGYLTIKNTPQYYSILPAAGVNASISDMAQWLLALLGERPSVISNETLSEIYKPEVVTPRRSKYEFFRWPNLKKASYGMGWRVLNYAGDTLVYHGGHVNGYRSEVGFMPSRKLGIVILTNAKGKIANDGVEIFFDAFLAYKKSLENIK